jgi:hypothetical protein
MSTAADELRAAAEHLRSLIAFLGDNRGPWKVGTPPSGYPQSISNVGVPYCVADTHEDPSIPTFTIAPYIAAMHPGVGKALARWLDEEADRDDNIPALHLGISGSTVHVPLDRVEDLIKGLRETAREVAAYSTGDQP